MIIARVRSHLAHTSPHCHPSSPQTVVQCHRCSLTVPAKPKKRHPALTLISHTHRAHNCLTFSDLMSACCFAPPRLCAAPAIKSKQTAHAEILPKTKARLRQSQSPAPLLGCSATLPLPFTGSLVSLGRAVPRQAHTGTDQHYTQHHGIQEERKLSARRMTLTGDAEGQGD